MTTGINLIVAIFFSLLSHPLHMSFTNIEYVDSLQRWEMSVKLFKDDFGDELLRMYGFDFAEHSAEDFAEDFAEDIADSTDYEKVFRKYLNRNLILKFDDERIETNSWVYQGSKINFEAVWLKFYFSTDKMPKNIRIKNELMFGLFNDQKNLLIFTHRGKQKAFQFKRKKPDIEFEID